MSRRRAEMYATAVYRSHWQINYNNSTSITNENNNNNDGICCNKSSSVVTASTDSTTNFVKDEEITNGENNNLISDTGSMKLVCYYKIPSNDSTVEQLFPENIDPLLCTHIIIAAAFIANGTLQNDGVHDIEVCIIMLNIYLIY